MNLNFVNKCWPQNLNKAMKVPIYKNIMINVETWNLIQWLNDLFFFYIHIDIVSSVIWNRLVILINALLL